MGEATRMQVLDNRLGLLGGAVLSVQLLSCVQLFVTPWTVAH